MVEWGTASACRNAVGGLCDYVRRRLLRKACRLPVDGRWSLFREELRKEGGRYEAGATPKAGRATLIYLTSVPKVLDGIRARDVPPIARTRPRTIPPLKTLFRAGDSRPSLLLETVALRRVYLERRRSELKRLLAPRQCGQSLTSANEFSFEQFSSPRFRHARTALRAVLSPEFGGALV